MRTRNVARRTSIVDSFHEPALRAQVFVHAIERGLFFIVPSAFRLNPWPQRPHLDVPFFAGPCGFGPPVAIRSPRSGKRENLSASAFATQNGWLSFLELNICRQRWPVDAHSRSCWPFPGLAFFTHFVQHKPCLLKRVRIVGIQQHRGTNTAFAYSSLNSRKCDFKMPGVGRQRYEEF